MPTEEGRLTDLSADQRAALAQLARSAMVESAATEVVSIGRALFKHGKPSDPGRVKTLGREEHVE